LEQCCVRASANVSYENAAKDVEAYTGIKVSAKTQQRIVQALPTSWGELYKRIQLLCGGLRRG